MKGEKYIQNQVKIILKFCCFQLFCSPWQVVYKEYRTLHISLSFSCLRCSLNISCNQKPGQSIHIFSGFLKVTEARVGYKWNVWNMYALIHRSKLPQNGWHNSNMPIQMEICLKQVNVVLLWHYHPGEWRVTSNNLDGFMFKRLKRPPPPPLPTSGWGV